MSLDKIKHVVVVMLENRSFDNLLGWLYADQDNQAPRVLPTDSSPRYDGLTPDTYSNSLPASPDQVFVTCPTTAWPPAVPNAMTVPTPDPNEKFEHVTQQLFGTAHPSAGAVPNMSGFYADYDLTEARAAGTSAQIMQTYSPEQVGVLSQLARSFAVSDAWFASVPTQTWPNRGFVHCGSSDGYINNDDYIPYNIPTVFNVLEENGVSWGIYADTDLVPSLTHGQFFQLWGYVDRAHSLEDFEHCCRAGADAPAGKKLPTYSFVEPRFVPELGWFEIEYPCDYHPPHDVRRGEKFVAQVYNAVRNSPYRDDILLVITFDEHGGCYDHCPPPGGALPPKPGAVSRNGGFHFDRFGVRVPAILVSSYVQPGTVFRAPSASRPGETPPPFDHTSILATLRDWLDLGAEDFFADNPRISAAPTLAPILDAPAARADWPAISGGGALPGDDAASGTPLHDMQKGLLALGLRMKANDAKHPTARAEAWVLNTYEEALRFLHLKVTGPGPGPAAPAGGPPAAI